MAPRESVKAVDAGRQAVDALYALLGIEPEWSVRDVRSFMFWSCGLAQRVWAEEPVDIDDERIARVHIETDVLSGLTQTQKALDVVAATNGFATLNALVMDDDRLRLHCSLCFSDENIKGFFRMAWGAAALQAGQAFAFAEHLAGVLNARPCFSAHPSSGVRRELHWTTGAAAVFAAAAGEERSRFSELEFGRLARLDPNPWVMAFNDVNGFSAEYPFLSDVPAFVATGQPGTALLQASIDQEHPQLGSGLLVRLSLPIQAGSEAAQRLNHEERANPFAEIHQLGAWCADGDGRLVFVTFIPNILFAFNLLENLLWHTAARCRWAKDLVVPNR